MTQERARNSEVTGHDSRESGAREAAAGALHSDGSPFPVPAELIEECFSELHVIARRVMRGEHPGHTLQPTALVAELWLKMASDSEPRIRSRAAFIARATVAMRHILVSHARRRLAEKRGGDRRRVPLEDSSCADPGWRGPQMWLELDEEIKSIESANSRAVRVFEMRYFGGMGFAEIAALLGITVKQASKDWRFVAQLLHARMIDLNRERGDEVERRDPESAPSGTEVTDETDADTATGRAAP